MTVELASWLAEEKRAIDVRLADFLPPASAFPATLHAAMRAAVLGGGKRLRAALLRALCEALGADAAAGMTAGCAVEYYHAATLVLDDLPCMDDAATRRGQPALHRTYGEATAVLAAESLFMRAVQLLSRPGRDGLPADAPAADLVARLMEATGSTGLMAGQHLDLMHEGQATDLETLEAIHTRKTGRLFTYCAEAAALLARAERPATASAIAFTGAFGLAFQISDDLLDAVGDAESMGKPTGQDTTKSTYVTHFGVEGARARLGETVAAAHEALEGLPGATAPLHALAAFLLTRTH